MFNLGNGSGYSVQEVIDTARRFTGRPIVVEDALRRAGDPARLVADCSRARQVLGWTPRYARLERIVEDAWRWESRQSAI
jgi:UDP-glucose 4-epimerase